MATNKKNLLVIGSYPSTEDGEKVLKSALNSVRADFDILLATHCPVSKDIQDMVQYFVYDHRNDIISFKNAVYFWADYPNFYFQLHQKQSNAYAVYRQLMNAAYLMEDYYEDFVYMEGDCIFSSEDVEKIKQFKEICESNKKEALFFKYDNFLASLVFYTKIKFFKEVFYFAKTPDDYQKYCTEIGSYGLLENFIYRNVERKKAFDRTHLIEYVPMVDYFNKSKLSVNSFLDGKAAVDRAYCAEVVKLKNSDKTLAFCYITHEQNQFESPVDVYLEDQTITTLPVGKHCIVVPINPKTDKFLIRLSNGHSYVFDKTIILSENNPNFAVLK